MPLFDNGRDASSPFLDSPPSTPWRIRARELQRRSPLLRPAALLALFFVFAVPIYLFTGVRSYASHDDLQHLAERPLAPTPARHAPWPNSPHRHSAPASANTPSSVPDPAAVAQPSTNVAAPALDPVIFSLIMWSANAASEGVVLIKSILMYASGPTHIHIICDDPAEEYVRKRLELVTNPRHDVLVRFYKPSKEEMEARVEREGSIATIHSAGTVGLMKLFIHEILPPSVKKTIFVDTDAFFISDPALLWAQFDAFAPATAISMPSHPEQSSDVWLDANKICSCVMLLDLHKLRTLRLMDSSLYRAAHDGVAPLSPPTFRQLFGAPDPATGKFEKVWLGDQSYWWAIVSKRPDVYRHLSYDWEVSSCLVDMYITGLGEPDMTVEAQAFAQKDRTDRTPHEGQAITPRLLHFNCMNTDNYFDWDGWNDPTDSLTRRWGAAVQYHVGYKWTWLNQNPHNDTKMAVETENHVVFADVRFAREKGISVLH